MKKATLFVLLAFFFSLSALPFVTIKPQLVRASIIDDLNAKKKALEQKAKQLQKEAETQKNVAERAEVRIEQVSLEIKHLENNIDSTESNIKQTKDNISQKNQEIANLESELRRINDQQSALVRQLYIMSVSMPDELALFSEEPISQREEQEARFTALKKSVATLYAKTTAAKLAVENNRNELVRKGEELEQLKVQQDEQKRGLANYRYEQAELKDNAESAMLTLEEKAKQAEIEANKVEQQISAALTAIINSRAKGLPLTGAGVGQRVRRSEVVGHEGSTGYSTGPHVHFEVRQDNAVVNPMTYINNGTLMWPMSDFYISQDFGYTSFARSGAYGGGMHTGIDLAGPYGAPVFAPADGTVIMNQWYGGYGYAWAEQLDNGLVVLLGHMTGK